LSIHFVDKINARNYWHNAIVEILMSTCGFGDKGHEKGQWPKPSHLPCQLLEHKGHLMVILFFM
jgi:hypothetical protein